jgi:hypothetical protein
VQQADRGVRRVMGIGVHLKFHLPFQLSTYLFSLALFQLFDTCIIPPLGAEAVQQNLFERKDQDSAVVK